MGEHPEIAGLPPYTAIGVQQAFPLHAEAFQHGDRAGIAVEDSRLDADQAAYCVPPVEHCARRMGGQPSSLPMRVEVIRELGAAVQEINGRILAETVEQFEARGGQVQRLTASWELAA